MITGPVIAEIAALVGDPARATMVSALLDGFGASRWPWPDGDRACLCGANHASDRQHPSREADGGGLRYFRLASPTVVDMIDGIVAVVLQKRPRYRPLSCEARALSAARICYDHLAGRLSVDLTDAFVARKYVVLDDAAAEITAAGTRFFTEFGIELPAPRSTLRHLCRLCLDWTERRPHIAGTVGAAITKRSFDLGWMERMKRSHAVIVTPLGRRGFEETFGIA